jgi:hypothetical protein
MMNTLNATNPLGIGTCFAIKFTPISGTASPAAYPITLLPGVGVQFTGPATVYVGTTASSVSNGSSAAAYTVPSQTTAVLAFVPNAILACQSIKATGSMYVGCLASNVVNVTPSSSSSTSHIGLIIGLIVLFLVLAALGVYLYNRYKKKKQATAILNSTTTTGLNRGWRF